MKLIAQLAFRFFSFIGYYWKAQSNLYIHSPFIFSWVNALTAEQFIKNETIQSYRDSLLNDKSDFRFIDFGQTKITSVSNRYMKTSITDFYGKLLMTTASYIKATNFLELGTSLGVSAAYICSSNSMIQGTTIDANPLAIEKSKKIFDRCFQNHNVNFVNGNFDETLSSILNESVRLDFVFIDGDHRYRSTINYVSRIKSFLSENSVIVLDDIRWSREMYKAWQELMQLSEFNYTVDFGRIGFLFKINNHSPKQHFYLY